MAGTRRVFPTLENIAVILSAIVGGIAGLIPGLAATDAESSILGGGLFGCITSASLYLLIFLLYNVARDVASFSTRAASIKRTSNIFLIAALGILTGALSAITTTITFTKPGQGYIALATGCFVNFLTVSIIAFFLIKRARLLAK